MNFFDYKLDNKGNWFSLKPRRWHLVLLIFGAIAGYFIIVSFYEQKQKELTVELGEVSMNYAQSMLSSLGPVRVDGKRMYAGDSLLNYSTYLVDSVKAVTGFGCTIFMEDVRIASSVFTHDSSSRVVGTKAVENITNRVLRAGRSFIGFTNSPGKKWIVVCKPLRDINGRIVGMIATFENVRSFTDGLRNFKLFLAAVLICLMLLIITSVELSLRWSRLIENQHFVLTEKNKQLKNISDELRLSYANLKASEEKFRDFFENSYDLIQSVDMNGKFLYVNSSWLGTLGYEPHEILELTTNDIVHPDYLEQYKELTKKAKGGEQILGEDMVFLNKERDAILLNGNVHCEFKDGKAVATRGVFRNDTNRKLALKKLEESEKQYRFLVESADDLIFRTDYKGNFIYANGIVKEITGFTKEEFSGKNYLDIVKDEHRQRVIDFYKNQFLSRLELSYFEFQIRKKNGSYVWVGQNVKTIFKGDDRHWIEGFLVVARDITDRKRKEEQINLQNKQLEDQNRSIKQSIRYAKRIQESILPNEKELSSLFPESFVFYLPKDIVSGDFYWVSKRDNHLFFAVADCTGHGVPAAFMSIIGSDQLNLAINRKRLVNPVDILNEISLGFQRVLKRPMDELEIHDGMDLAICSIDMTTNELQFAGAFNDMYLVRNEKLLKYRGTRISVGLDEKIRRSNHEYELHSLVIKSSDVIYLFSDGYADQFGGDQGRKLGYEKFREILLKIHQEPMSEQKRLLNETITEWRSGEDQIDDMCVLGLRF